MYEKLNSFAFLKIILADAGITLEEMADLIGVKAATIQGNGYRAGSYLGSLISALQTKGRTEEVDSLRYGYQFTFEEGTQRPTGLSKDSPTISLIFLGDKSPHFDPLNVELIKGVYTKSDSVVFLLAREDCAPPKTVCKYFWEAQPGISPKILIAMYICESVASMPIMGITLRGDEIIGLSYEFAANSSQGFGLHVGYLRRVVSTPSVQSVLEQIKNPEDIHIGNSTFANGVGLTPLAVRFPKTA